jgi:hypothetical protein
VKRNIKLISIKDVNVIDFVDGGVDREGEPTSQRQALTRILGKRVSAVVDGKEHTLPVFLISDVGDWRLAPSERLPNGDEFLAYEQDVIRREHPERMLATWKKAQAQFISQSTERRRYAEQQAEQAQSADVAKVISQMVRSVSQQTSTQPQRKGGMNV